MTPTASQIETAAIRLARELGVNPFDLEYLGVQKGLSYDLLLFNINKPGPGNGTTRSIRVDL